MTIITKSSFSLLFILFSLNIYSQTIALTSSVGTDQQTVCINSSITPIEYTIGDGATNVSFTGLPMDITTAFSAGVFTISGNSTISGNYPYTISTIGGVNSGVMISGIITVNPQITPTFSAIAPVCLNSVSPILPTTSNNILPINGTWSPAVVSTSFAGTINYTFTPSAGQCANSTTLPITVVGTTPIIGALTFCQGSTTQLSNNSIGGIWSSSDVNIASVDATGLVTGLNQGVSTISYSVSAGCGTVTEVITVNSLPIVQPITGNFNVCIGESTLLLDTSPSGVWSTTSSLVATISSTGIVSGVSAGTIIISYSVTINGCTTSVNTALTVIANPIINAGVDQTICQGTSIVLSGSGAATYTWDNSISNGQSFIPTIGSTTYTVTGIDLNGCVGTGQVSISVNVPITPTFNIIAPICIGSIPPILSNNSNDIIPISGNWTPVSNSTETTIYTFIPNAGECANSTTLEVVATICTPDSNLVATVIPTSVSQNGICDGTAEVVISAGDAPFSCTFPNGINSLTITNLCEGLNSVIVTDANGDTLWLDFIIGAPSNTTSTTNLLDSTIVDTIYNPAVINCVINYLAVDSAYINYYTIVSDTSVLVNWAVVSSGIITNYSDTYYLYAGTGVYMITLQIYCPTKSISEFLVSTDQIYFNAAFAGIKQDHFNSETISIYPNPFTDQLTISLDKNQTSEITISDITGKVVLSQSSSDKIIQLDMSNLSSGQYIVMVKSETSIMTSKIVK